MYNWWIKPLTLNLVHSNTVVPVWKISTVTHSIPVANDLMCTYEEKKLANLAVQIIRNFLHFLGIFLVKIDDTQIHIVCMRIQENQYTYGFGAHSMKFEYYIEFVSLNVNVTKEKRNIRLEIKSMARFLVRLSTAITFQFQWASDVISSIPVGVSVKPFERYLQRTEPGSNSTGWQAPKPWVTEPRYQSRR